MAEPQTGTAAQGSAKEAEGRGAGLGTFEGVFTPSILTILGVIMYLRFGWVVGNVGLIGTLVIVTICTSITMLTALSMSAIATDRRVRTGGAYYMISRSLGIETGGAVGIPVYFAIALSVALYVVGFAESVVNVFPTLSQRWVGIVTAILVAGLALYSARLALRAQFFIMAAIVVSLLSFAFGKPLEPTTMDLTGAPPRLSEGFWVVLAVFFPAVTGIEAGVNMSGDLRDPQRSIPRGTLAALIVGYIVYMTLPIFLSLRADPETLIQDPLIMRDMAFWGEAILIGVWGATLSSAMGSILGAPRVLQALARDGVLPRRLRILGRGSGDDDAPRVATVVTLGLALIAIWLGDLNVIAPVLSMFFLASYLTVNLAAGIEGLLKSPSYRPSFKVHWAFSLLGAAACLVVMFLINAVATVVAAAVIVGVYVWLERRELRAAWGDVRRGVGMALVRSLVMRMDPSSDPRNWRPHLLILSGAPTRRWSLIDLASSLTHGHGMVTVSSVLRTGTADVARMGRMERSIREYMGKRGVQALVRLISAPDPFDGAEQLLRAYGLGPLVPNTVVLGDSQEPTVRERYCAMIRRFHEGRRNVIILRDDQPLADEPPADGEQEVFGDRRQIDVWWGGLQANGGLMMVLAYLLRTSTSWFGARLCVKLVVPNEVAAESARENLERIIGGLRLGAEAHVMVAEGRPFPEILHESSREADLVFLGMAAPDDDFVAYYERMQALSAGLPTTAFVLAGEDVDFSEVLL